MNGLVLHLGTEGDAGSSFILDMTPNSLEYDWDDLALPERASFTDDASGVTITADWVDQTSAAVDVAYAQPQCVRRNPTVFLSPSQGPWVPPGALVSFAVTVTNNDSSVCAGATFDLAGSLPAGWVSNFATAALTLAPGASAATVFAVTSATLAADGYYDVGVSATNHGETVYAGSGTGTYIVSAATGDQAPVAVADAAAMAQNTAVAINVLANDSDPDGDPLVVVAVTQPAHGNVTLGAGGTITYVPAKRFKGTDTCRYTVSDGQLTASATISVIVGAKARTR
jgi:hypothetical protein